MTICWYCHWGWHPKVREIYQRHVDLIEEQPEVDGNGELVSGEFAMKYGPAHVVWADENFERESVQRCIEECDRQMRKDDRVLALVRQSLVELLALPDDVLMSKPKDYDGENPENFPPAWEEVASDPDDR